MLVKYLPEKYKNGGRKSVEVVVPVNFGVVVQCHFAKHLHSDDSVNEEEENNQQGDIWKGLGFEQLNE
jgi:hypothetical protein